MTKELKYTSWGNPYLGNIGDDTEENSRRVLMTKDYCGEDFVDVGEDVCDSLDDLPVDEHGFIKGTIKVTVEYIPEG